MANPSQLQNRLRRGHRYSRARHRLRDIKTIIQDRHESVPQTDDADLYLVPVAQCFGRITRENGGKRSTSQVFAFWCEEWAPHIGGAQQVAIIEKALECSWPNDDDLGRQLRLSDSDRTRLQIRTIGAYDVDRRLRAKRKKEKKRPRDRLRAAEKRRANGAIPRDVYESASLTRTKPWEHEGISRATYFRRRNQVINSPPLAVETSPSPIPSLYRQATDLSQNPLTPDPIDVTTPANAGTPSKTVWVGVDGAAVVGNHTRRFKARFPTSLRLTKAMKAYALAACFKPDEIGRMFEMFRDFNLAARSYSAD